MSPASGSYVGPIFLGSNQSHIYPNMCARCACCPTVVSKKGGGTDSHSHRQRDIAAYSIFNTESMLSIQLPVPTGYASTYLTRIASLFCRIASAVVGGVREWMYS